MSTGAMGVLLGPDLDVALQLRWAVRLAEARESDLLIIQWVENREARSVEAPLDEAPEGEGAATVTEVIAFVAGSPELSAGARPEEAEGETTEEDAHVVHVRLLQIHCENLRALRQQLLTDVTRNKLKLLAVVRSDLDATNAEVIRQRRLFLRYVPCDVIFCYGLQEDHETKRILVAAAGGPHSSAALEIGRDLAAASDGSMTVLRVNPDVGPDAERVGRRRLDGYLKKSLGKELSGVRRRVVIDDQISRGVRKVWDEGVHDLVVVGASRLGVAGSEIGRGIGAKLLKGDPKPAVAIYSVGSPIRNRLLGMVEGGIERLVPQIGREERVALVDRVQSSSNWDFDFFALMLLSTVIAAIGLIQDSAAVVIGAMLVAPLMTPLLGLGLALVQGNPVMARISVRSIALGLFVSLLVGMLVGLATPGFAEPTREMLARGGPGLLDLFVAFASGLAAAYASSRSGLLAALPGVAIAAALVPPIATAGLALSLGNWHLALGALLLFLINMATIVLASMMSLWAVGIRNIKRASRWTFVAASVVFVLMLALGISTSVTPINDVPTQEVPSNLLRSVDELLGVDYRLDSFAMAYDELGVQLNIRVVGRTLAPEELAERIRAAAREHFAKPVRVRLVTQVEAGAH